jgi:hypothetical protein
VFGKYQEIFREEISIIVHVNIVNILQRILILLLLSFQFYPKDFQFYPKTILANSSVEGFKNEILTKDGNAF